MSIKLPETEEIRALVERASQLPALRAPERLGRLVEDYARGRNEAQRSLVVALVGATGAGKSTLLNALAGSDLSREGEHRPTSRQAVVYAPDDAVVGPLAALGARVVRYAHHEEGLWAGQVFVDTPDVNSVEVANREVAHAMLEHADVGLVVLHRGSVAEATQAEFLSEFARRRQLVFVINFADELGLDARQQLKTQVARLAMERFAAAGAQIPVFAISAREAKTGGDPSGELAAFLAHLEQLGETATRERILRSNAVGALKELAEIVGGALSAQEAWEGEVGTALSRGLDTGLRTLEQDFAERLQTTLAHLRVETRQEAATRWWGPSAWWMKLSAVGGSGVGAAALLARTSPLSAAALAAGSAALSALQRKTLAASAERRIEAAYVDEDAEVGRAVRAVLTGPRTLAEQRGMKPEALGLPEESHLAELLRQQLAGAWRFTQEQAVGQAVERWWRWARWLLVPLINFPLLALLGHVAYRVVRGYYEGTYLPVDYYLNALALAAVFSIVGALLGSTSLAGVAKRAAASGQRRLRSGLEDVRQSLSEAPRRAQAPAREAARTLISAANTV